MTTLRAAIALCASLFLASCLPVTTTVPVGSTAGFKPDPALSGAWIGRNVDPKDDDNPGYLHFVDNDDGSMTLIIVSSPHGTEKGDWSVWNIRAATLGPNRLLNASEVSDNGKKPEDDLAASIPMLYRVARNGDVTLYLVDEDAAKAAIRAGKIKGTIDPGDTGDVHITADAAALDAYFASPAAAALFPKPLLILKRLKE